MNWPTAFEAASAHFATAYLWHDALTVAAKMVAPAFAGGIGLALGWWLCKCIWDAL